MSRKLTEFSDFIKSDKDTTMIGLNKIMNMLGSNLYTNSTRMGHNLVMKLVLFFDMWQCS